MVSNLTDSHEPEYIKPIGEFLVDFLNTDLTGYEEGLKKMHNLLCNTEIKSPMEFIFPVMDFIYPYFSQERFLFGAYVYYPLVCAFNKLAEYTEKNIPVNIPKKVYREWYNCLKEYLYLCKRYRKFIDYIFNLRRSRFEDLNRYDIIDVISVKIAPLKTPSETSTQKSIFFRYTIIMDFANPFTIYR